MYQTVTPGENFMRTVKSSSGESLNTWESHLSMALWRRGPTNFHLPYILYDPSLHSYTAMVPLQDGWNGQKGSGKLFYLSS